MKAREITPLVLTYNEAPNIERTLARLSWASRVVVVDSCSTDQTVEICRRFPQVEVFDRRFDDHTSQWNFGLDQVATAWVLSLDADYILSEQLIAELCAGIDHGSDVAGYFARFRYCVFGKPLRASLYPPRLVLFRKANGRYVQDGHTQLLKLEGATASLDGLIDHDDRKSLDRWFANQMSYSALEARHLLETPATELSRIDRIRRWVVIAPALVFAYTLLWQRLLLDAWPGWFYAFQRGCAEIMLSLRMVEARLRK